MKKLFKHMFRIMFGISLFINFVGAGFIGYNVSHGTKLTFPQFSQEEKDKQEGTLTTEELQELSVEVPEITTNLNNRQYVKITLHLVADSKKSAEELNERLVQISDIITKELNDTSTADLTGKENLVNFGYVIQGRINELLKEGEVREVYIVSIITA